MNVCVLVMAIAALVCAVATSFSLLVAMRIVAGLVAGGVFPVAMALLGDLVPINQRQVAIARLLAIALTGNVLGASIAGVIGDLFGWRGVFAILGSFSLAVVAAAFWALPQLDAAEAASRSTAPRWSRTSAASSPTRAPSSASARCSSRRSSSRDCFPMSRCCCSASARPAPRSPGLLIACFAIGGIVYSLSVPYLVARVAERRLMVIGGAIAAAAWR